MIKTWILKNIWIIFIIVFTYLLFFYKLLNPANIIYSGKDSVSLHYSAKLYLFEKINSGEFPFWTERQLLGFPIYADLEKGYLNIITLISTYLLGPFSSYKLTHFLCYFIGSFSLYLFLKKFGTDTLAFTVANVVYFFTFFPLYHQQHFNMTLTYYLFPFGLLMLDRFIQTNYLRYGLINAFLLAYCFYLGSFQFVFLFILLELAYLYYSLGINKKSFIFLIFSFSLFFILILPGLFSTYTLFSRSARQGDIMHTMGSFTPVMIINVLFPFIFNFSDDYMGTLQSTDYVMHETYVYVGISTILFSLIGYLYLNNSQTKKYINFLIIVFFITAFIGSIPFVNSLNIIPISLFRYWPRSISLLNLSLSILIYNFISHFKFNISVQKFFENKYILFPVLFLIFLEIINYKNFDFITLFNILKRSDYHFGYWYFIYLAILFLTISVFFIKFLQNKHFVSFLIFLDIVLFGFIATKDSLIKSIDDVITPKFVNGTFNNSRVLDYRINGDNVLINTSWGLSGYPVLYQSDLNSLVSDLGTKSIRYPSQVEINTNNIEKFANIGLSKIIDRNGFITDISSNNTLIANTDITTYIQKEGLIEFNTNFTEITLINTFISDYPGWTVYIDDSEITHTIKNRFISFDVPKGFHNIRIQFIPINLYNGIKLSILGLIIYTFTSYYIARKYKKVICF